MNVYLLYKCRNGFLRYILAYSTRDSQSGFFANCRLSSKRYHRSRRLYRVPMIMIEFEGPVVVYLTLLFTYYPMRTSYTRNYFSIYAYLSLIS
ncbi:hypothetical protein C8Q75DRAFT_760459 [Abortiporus biennis]|nr:hypothetical protein C8Q75DRAFT_760459 [Abortiporus biennis]